jgi:hypothetical protein
LGVLLRNAARFRRHWVGQGKPEQSPDEQRREHDGEILGGARIDAARKFFEVEIRR